MEIKLLLKNLTREKWIVCAQK